MSGVIDVINRPIGADDISFGPGSFVFVDINGVARRVGQVNAGNVPWLSIPSLTVDALVDGSKLLPVGASSLGVAGTSTLSGPIYCSSTTSGFVRSAASGQLLFGQVLVVADIPSSIPAVNIGSGTVNDAMFGYVANATSNIQSQINAINAVLVNALRLQYFNPVSMPRLVYVSATTVRVVADANTPARVIMSGMTDVQNPCQFVTAGLTNSQYYAVSTNTDLAFPGGLYGSVESANQWYAVYAIAGATDYSLKAMPWMRVKSQASQVISMGTNVTPATGIGYGFTTDQFVGGVVYVISGSSKGLVRTITANNNDAGTGGTVSYGGAALTLAQGDWFTILPNTNFRWLGDIFNDNASNIRTFIQRSGEFYYIPWITTSGLTTGVQLENVTMASPMADRLLSGYYLDTPTSDCRVIDANEYGAVLLGINATWTGTGPMWFPLAGVCSLLAKGTWNGLTFHTSGYKLIGT